MTDIDTEILDLLTKQRDKTLAAAEDLQQKIGEFKAAADAARHYACTMLEKANKALCDALEHMEMASHGAALDALQYQLKRLMETPCPSMAFGFGPEETAKAVISEVQEILAEPAGSEAAQRECGGLLAAAVRLSMVHGADPIEGMAVEAKRLGWRLDTMKRLGCSWAAAKVIEADPQLEHLWCAITLEAITCEIAAWTVYGGKTVAVMPTAPLSDTQRDLIYDCFPGMAVRISPDFDEVSWRMVICGAVNVGRVVAVRDAQGPRFFKKAAQ